MSRWLLALLLGFGALASRAAEPAPAAPVIEALLRVVATRSDITFIRNGSDYNAATAAKFLRGKWERAQDEVKSPEDFITKIATKSSTTGQAYRLRFPDGHEVDCADFLRDQLAALRPH